MTNIYVNRELVASETYAAARDQWDEGIFSTSFYDDDTTSDGGGAFKWTKLNNGNLNNIVRWIALEDGSDENAKMFKGAPNWSYYAYIIQVQKK